MQFVQSRYKYCGPPIFTLFLGGLVTEMVAVAWPPGGMPPLLWVACLKWKHNLSIVRLQTAPFKVMFYLPRVRSIRGFTLIPLTLRTLTERTKVFSDTTSPTKW